MTDFTTEDLIQELQAYHQPMQDRRPGGVTVIEWAESQNISDKRARKQLRQLVADGVLVEEHCRLAPNAQGFVYYKRNSSNGE